MAAAALGTLLDIATGIYTRPPDTGFKLALHNMFGYLDFLHLLCILNCSQNLLVFLLQVGLAPKFG